MADPKGYYSTLVGEGSYTVSTLVPGYVTNSTSVQVTPNEVKRVYYLEAMSPGFLIEKVSGSSSARISGEITGEANPIPEFPINVVPVVITLTILMALLASRKIGSVKTRKG